MVEVDRLCDRVVILNKGCVCFDGTIQQMYSVTGQTHLDKAFLALIRPEEAHDAA